MNRRIISRISGCCIAWSGFATPARAADDAFQKVPEVAVAPETGPHDFHKWAAVIHRQCDGKLPGGYAFEVLYKGGVVAKGAAGWARAPGRRPVPA